MDCFLGVDASLSCAWLHFCADGLPATRLSMWITSAARKDELPGFSTFGSLHTLPGRWSRVDDYHSRHPDLELEIYLTESRTGGAGSSIPDGSPFMRSGKAKEIGQSVD